MPEKDYGHVLLSAKLGAKPGAEVTVFFTTEAAELRRRFPKLKRTLGPADALWIAWPKRASKLETDLTFADVQRIGLENGWSTTSPRRSTTPGRRCVSSTGGPTGPPHVPDRAAEAASAGLSGRRSET